MFCFKVNELFKNWVLKFGEEGSFVLVRQQLAAVVMVVWDDMLAAVNTVISKCNVAEYLSQLFTICFKALVRQVCK